MSEDFFLFFFKLSKRKRLAEVGGYSSSPKVLADLLGENEKEILMGGYSNLELFPAEAGILVAAARTIRSLYVFATEFCEGQSVSLPLDTREIRSLCLSTETDPATLETRVRRMLAQQEIVTHWTDSITPANRMLFVSLRPACLLRLSSRLEFMYHDRAMHSAWPWSTALSYMSPMTFSSKQASVRAMSTRKF